MLSAAMGALGAGGSDAAGGAEDSGGDVEATAAALDEATAFGVCTGGAASPEAPAHAPAKATSARMETESAGRRCVGSISLR